MKKCFGGCRREEPADNPPQLRERWLPTLPCACAWGVIFLALTFPVSSPGQSGEAPDSGVKNVIFIILDALRADHLGIYGYDRNTSPSIDALARKGLVFDRAIVQAGWTKPSMASYMTSLSPAVHKVLLMEDVLPDNVTTMSEIFRENGYYTCGFVHNPHMAPTFGFNRGFDIYRQLKNDDRILDMISELFAGRYMDDELIRSDRFLDIVRKKNILSNSGFEEGMDGWLGSGSWLTGDTVHSGRQAIHISRGDNSDKKSQFLKRRLKLAYGTNYIVGAFVRTRGLQGKLTVEIKEGEGFRVVARTPKEVMEGDNEWTLVWRIFKPATSDSESNNVSVEIGVGIVRDFVEGEFWVDDVFILPVDDLPPLYPTDKLFVYLHLLDPHSPYEPPAAYLNYFKSGDKATIIDKYDAEIRAVDNKLKALLEGLDSSGLLKDTLVVITSDHGESFGEHELWQHGPKFFYDETSRVPLIFYNRRLFPDPDRVDKTVRAIDLLPSLADLLDLDLPSGSKFQGDSYFSSRRSLSSYAVLYECPHPASQDSGKVFVRTVTDGSWKYFSNKYYLHLDGVDIRSVYHEDRGIELKVISDSGEKTLVCRDEESLKESGFLESFEPRVREEIINLFNQTPRKLPVLYWLENDPGETKNVIDDYPEIAKKFKEIVERQIDDDLNFENKSDPIPVPKIELSQDLNRQFRALGYLK